MASIQQKFLAYFWYMQCRWHKLILGDLSTNLKKVKYENAMIRQWEENWFMKEKLSYDSDYRKMHYKYLITYNTGLQCTYRIQYDVAVD